MDGVGSKTTTSILTACNPKRDEWWGSPRQGAMEGFGGDVCPFAILQWDSIDKKTLFIKCTNRILNVRLLTLEDECQNFFYCFVMTSDL